MTLQWIQIAFCKNLRQEDIHVLYDSLQVKGRICAEEVIISYITLDIQDKHF